MGDQNGVTLYEEKEPFKSYHLDLAYEGAGHRMHVSEYGNPDGIKVICLHGGPGAPSSSVQLYFDPEKYHIIVPHQRGAGRSESADPLKNNTPRHLVEDIEQLRQHLGGGELAVYGTSWGATLSLLYAQAYPENTAQLLLGSISLFERDDTVRQCYEALELRSEADCEFIEFLSEAQQQDPFQSYYDMIMGDDDVLAAQAARHWQIHDVSFVYPLESVKELFAELPDEAVLAVARVQLHYFMNHSFEDDYILSRVDRIKHIPADIVHGKNDELCPVEDAKALKDVYGANARLHITEGGHSSKDAGNIETLFELANKIGAPKP